MNLTYHTMAGIAASGIILNKKDKKDKKIKFLFLSFLSGIFSHSLLDLIPHSYSLNIITDISLTIFLFCLILIFSPYKNNLLILIPTIFSILPDIIDKLIIKILFKSSNYIFIWHKPEYINKFYDIYIKISNPIYYWITDFIIIFVFLYFLKKYKNLFLKNKLSKQQKGDFK